jgi:Carboxypeptidase regulatory-like domain
VDARKLRVAGVCWLVLSGVGAGAHAQVGAGALAGEVMDQAGAPVPGAILTAIDVGTGLTRTVVTTREGSYSIPSLPPGTYRVRAELSGFRTSIRDGIRLATGETVRLDLQLELGGVSEEVTVGADA